MDNPPHVCTQQPGKLIEAFQVFSTTQTTPMTIPQGM